MKRSVQYPFFLFLAGIMLCGCMSQERIVYFQDDKKVSSIEDTLESIRKKYTLEIARGDIVNISVMGVNEETYKMFSPGSNNQQRGRGVYTRGSAVDSAGYIQIPYLGKVKVGGLTIQQAEDSLKKKLSLYLKNPTVEVKLLNFYVTVMGSVNQPGMYRAVGENMTLMQALAKAGDITPYGNREDIQIIRSNRLKDQYAVHRVDMTNGAIFGSSEMYLKPHDIVYVKPTRREQFKNIQPIVSLTSSIVSIGLVLINVLLI